VRLIGREIRYLFSKAFRQVLGTTQSSIQWAIGNLPLHPNPWVKRCTWTHTAMWGPTLRIRGVVPPHSLPHAFMTRTPRTSLSPTGRVPRQTPVTTVAWGIPPTRQGPIRLQHNKEDCVMTSNDRPFNKDKKRRGSCVTGWQQQRVIPVRANNLHLELNAGHQEVTRLAIWFTFPTKTGTPFMIRLACPGTDIYRQPHTCAETKHSTEGANKQLSDTAYL
jgi:hypothetical protein